MAKKKEDTQLQVVAVAQDTVDFAIVGTSPIILNRMSQKAMRELLLPSGRKTAVDRASSLKHDPITEYQSSPYTLRGDSEPTWIGVPGTSFKSAMGTAALDLPGAKRAVVGRLTWVNPQSGGLYVPVWGIPKLAMSVVRSADMNRTPDIRTRAILPQWACIVSVTFIKPLIQAAAVANLMAAAGLTAGVGDWRPEKGKGNFGQFRLAAMDDPEFQQIVATGGRDAQINAMQNPEPHDHESADLLAWFVDELEVRRQAGRAPKPRVKQIINGGDVEETGGVHDAL
jgi:hypothetical protein